MCLLLKNFENIKGTVKIFLKLLSGGSTNAGLFVLTTLLSPIPFKGAQKLGCAMCMVPTRITFYASMYCTYISKDFLFLFSF